MAATSLTLPRPQNPQILPWTINKLLIRRSYAPVKLAIQPVLDALADIQASQKGMAKKLDEALEELATGRWPRNGCPALQRQSWHHSL